MQTENSNLKTLVYILENCLRPEVLDSHPWTKSLVVLETLTDTPELENKSAGQRLVVTVAKFFTQMMPANAPQRDKTLDARWRRFGILAAQYFAPLLFGVPAPLSLQEAWKQIDKSILLFAFGKADESISQEKRDAYQLGDGEAQADSALKDWRDQGLRKLMDALSARERFLSKSLQVPAVIESRRRTRPAAPAKSGGAKSKPIRKQAYIFLAAAALVFLALLVIGGIKIRGVYRLTDALKQDVTYIQNLLEEPAPRLGKFRNVGSAVSKLRTDFGALKKETEPFFWMGPLLKWMPTRGGDLASIKELAALVDSLLASADISYQALAPLIEEDNLEGISPIELSAFLKDKQPEMLRAQQTLLQAERARARLNIESLSPDTRALILNNADPLIELMRDSLTLAVELPKILGAGAEGPQTYLLLVQNEDELRPTGGFITAASSVVIQDGNLGSLSFVNSGELDNWYKLYPAAPWQLKEYMNSPVLVFRDSNWFTNYPTAALYAKYLYAYANDNSVNGVIAFDQRLLVEILRVSGPIQIDDAPTPIDADNIIQYMRESKTPDRKEANSSAWDNKAFLNKIAYSLIEKMFSGEIKWELMSTMLVKALNERHLLLQVDNPAIAALLARYQWDGSLQPGAGDFLMAVDTNIGFNKTNAVVESSISYDIDLTNPDAPVGSLVISHKNNSAQEMICKQWLKERVKGEENYPITDCYWNYLRVYKPAGAVLVHATPQAIPDAWMINKQKNPGQVDLLEEEIHGVQGFGALQVVPAGETLSIDFQFALPSNILKVESNRAIYILKVKKQPGTQAVPFTLRAHLASGASIESLSPGAIIEGSDILYKTNLETDREFTIIFLTS